MQVQKDSVAQCGYTPGLRNSQERRSTTPRKEPRTAEKMK